MNVLNISKKDVKWIQQQVYGLLEFTYKGEITAILSECLTVEGDENSVVIGCKSKSEFARGLFLFAKDLKAGKKKVLIKQKANFKMCGVMLDFSRGCVFTVDAVKRYLTHMAALGMNMMMLYLEDVYELPGYPYFGYMRGRYTKEEIRAIDDYAYSLGIELIPCVQTLGHLLTYLRWGESDPVQDSPSVLLVGEEKTYDMIKTILRTISETYHSRRIHIGMDEAHDMGSGAYSKRHKEIDQKKMFVEHLSRVKAMCKEEGLEPMMWSDMLFRLCGGEGGLNEEYDSNSIITGDIAEVAQGMNLSYWDYYRTEQSQYENIIERHQKFDADISFAGGIWTWDGYLPNFRYTLDVSFPALRACLKRGVAEVFATSWGENGTDTDYMQSIPALAIFSEFCYRGLECTEEIVFEVAEALTGTNKEILLAASKLFLGHDGAVGMGRRLIDSDLFYEQLRYPMDYEKIEEEYHQALGNLEKYTENKFAMYTMKVIKIALAKAELFSRLRPAYRRGDSDVLKEIAYQRLPQLLEDYKQFCEVNEHILMTTRKPFGIEMLQIRYAGVEKRLQYAKNCLEAYLRGEKKTIPELDEEALYDEEATWLTSDSHMKTLVWPMR